MITRPWLALAAALISATPAFSQDAPAVFRLQLPAPLLVGPEAGAPPSGGGTDTGNPAVTITAEPGTWRAEDAIFFPVDIDTLAPVEAVEGAGLPGTLAYDRQLGGFAGVVTSTAAPYVFPFEVTARFEGWTASESFAIGVYPKLSADAGSVTVAYGEAVEVAADAQGVVGTASWDQVDGGLPPGVSHTEGVLSGTPSEPGFWGGIALEVTDSFDGRQARTAPFSIAVTAPQAVVSAEDARVRVGDAVSVPVSVSGYGDFEVAAVDAPDWVEFDGSTITGNPGAGVHVIGLRASNRWATATGSVTVEASPALSAAAPPATVPFGQPLSVAAVASGVVGDVTWSLVGGTLPPGVSHAGGVLSGTPSEPGEWTGLRLMAVDSHDGRSAVTPPFSVTVTAPQPAISVADVTARAGDTVSIPVSVSGGHGSYTLSIEDKPEWARLDGPTVTGTVPQGTHVLTIVAANEWSSASRAVTVTALPALAVTLDRASVTATYGTPLGIKVAESNAVGTATMTLSGAPAWLSISDTGVLSGTPVAVTSHPGITVRVTDSRDGRTATSQPFTVTVVAKEVTANLGGGLNKSIRSIFSDEVWNDANIVKRAVLPSGTTIGSNSPHTPALSTGVWAGKLVLENHGQILGAGGLANGGTGGTALKADKAGMVLRNHGSILSGGGGGGRGGQGGGGRVQQDTTVSEGPYYNNVVGAGAYSAFTIDGVSFLYYWGNHYPPLNANAVAGHYTHTDGWTYAPVGLREGRNLYEVRRYKTVPGTPTYTTGGPGGDGGRGQGNDGVLAGGTAGAAGGANAGRGGTGGTGGAYGQPGGTGGTGAAGNNGAGSAGAGGGPAGLAIDGTVTVEVQGDIRGRRN